MFFIAAIPAVLSLLLTPLVVRFASAIGAIDLPNERKIHKNPTPRLGGIAIYLSFFLSLALFFNWPLNHQLALFFESGKAVWLLGALLLVFSLGIWDDLRALNPGKKFLVQVLAATIVYAGGFRISTVTDFFGSGHFDLGALDYPMTVLWIVGVTNAFNLIDGLDGLASGIAVIAALTMCAVSFFIGELTTACMALVLAGAVLGFLPYNFNPARIFLGDSGSLLIGFTLAVFSMESSTKGTTAFAILVPVLALGLPIMDTLLSMARRVLSSLLPETKSLHGVGSKLHSMFLPDKKHVHHQLMAMGLSHRSVVLILYVVSCAFGLVAFAVTVSNNVGASLILVAVGLATFSGIKHLRYKEMAILSNGVLLPLYEWPVLNRALFQGFLDLGFSGIAFALAYYLTLDETLIAGEFLYLAPIVCGVQPLVFFFSGLYKGSLRHLGVGDLLKITKTVALAVLVTGVVLAILPEPRHFISTKTLIADFFILLTLVLGTRSSFHVLNYQFQREKKRGKGILIYGAGANGVLTLQKILMDDDFVLNPLGFLDDNPDLEGKNVNGYPIFGGHWKLPRLLRKTTVEEIIIASESLHPEILDRVKRVARDNRVTIRRSKLLLEEIPTEKRANTNERPAVLLHHYEGPENLRA